MDKIDNKLEKSESISAAALSKNDPINCGLNKQDISSSKTKIKEVKHGEVNSSADNLKPMSIKEDNKKEGGYIDLKAKMLQHNTSEPIVDKPKDSTEPDLTKTNAKDANTDNTATKPNQNELSAKDFIITTNAS
jgi:hypothetical protein